LRELAAIIIVQGRQPEKETVEKAEREGIPILGSPLHTFELVGRLYQMGISGMH
jgi:serine kinase of HPr protein (carbohydrate metabolism regulator)